MEDLFDERRAFGGKVVVLTGAASGMGLRAAQRLAKAGAKVTFFYERTPDFWHPTKDKAV